MPLVKASFCHSFASAPSALLPEGSLYVVCFLFILYRWNRREGGRAQTLKEWRSHIVVVKSCLPLHDPMDCSTPGFPVSHHLLEFSQVHVCWIRDSIQSFHPLLPSSLSAFSLSQHQGLFQWVRLFTSDGQSIRVSASGSVLPMSIQSWFPLRLNGLIFLLSKGLSRVFSSTTVQKHRTWHKLIRTR